MSTIVGLFDYYKNADQAIQNLQNYGVESDRISVAKPSRNMIERGTGAATGGPLNAFVDLGFSIYAEGLKCGGIVIFVETDSQEHDDQGEINYILRDAGAMDVNTRQQTWNDGGRVSVEEIERPYKEASH